MGKRDYYEILGIGRSATADEVRKAHRKLARQYHPDMNKNNVAATEKFKEVQEAYDVLSDPDKRRTYDQFGHAGMKMGSPPGAGDPFDAFRRAGATGGGGWRSANSGVGAQDFDMPGGFSSIFEQLFGSRGGGHPGAGGAYGRAGHDPFGAEHDEVASADAEHTVQLTFEQAALGTKLPIRLSGSSGVETIEVKVPAGTTDGTRVRLKGRGGQRGNGTRGDLFIVYRVSPHPVFRREGLDVYCDANVPVYDALLGGKVTVPTLEGEVTLSIPAGTSSGAKLRVKGKGIHKSGDAGDLYAVVRIVVPRELSPEARELAERLRKDATV
ncbi:DnaJ C-terminal domain-containing protein [Cyanobium sp. Cruz-8H5]|uniref:DnaJ C-terminal domain-containing protein n=1 Tax=Cyanobium sp. Cruz-8H5 TaxID=2823712 RepID=UPI0020CC51A1|nr:J domain-containing protein [Cyanobium sp. Cruz-8H5]MCP9861436.1 J domain-containing protein [Cyanobium sp. Cruz-8H5]